MNDPYSTLGLSGPRDPETVRRRYLKLVREFPPEQHPERFAEIRRAYEQLQNPMVRLQNEVLKLDRQATIAAVIEAVVSRRSRTRIPMKILLEQQNA